MGMMPSYIKLVASMHNRYQFQGPVCSLGNQDVWASKEDLINCLKEVNCRYTEPTSSTPHSSRTFSMNLELTRLAKDFVHAKTMFEAMGLFDYVDLDKFDSDSPEILHDLNLPIPEKLINRFGLVFDGGTIEHIFDVRQVLENIGKMVCINGCVIHLCSISIDHGFYGFSPLFYYDYYSVNGFGEFECYLMELDLSNVTQTYDRKHRYIKYQYGMSLDGVLDKDKEILIFFAARKFNEVTQSIVPTQGSYASRGNLEDAPPIINKSAFERLIPLGLQPLLRPFRRLLRAIYKKYLRYKARQAATIRYI